MIALAGAVLPAPAGAQSLGTVRRPGDVRPTLPRFDDEAPPPDRVLPRILPPDTSGLGATRAGARVFVREYAITGNTVLPEATLRGIAVPYVGRELSWADLERLRDELTRAYVDAGYLTSGAWIPDQAVENGVIEIRIQEGVLGELSIESDRRLSSRYVENRLHGALVGPLNLRALEERLQILRQDPVVAAVDAELRPGAQRGEGDLHVRVREADPFELVLAVDDYEPATIGEPAGHAWLTTTNLTGFGDLGNFEYTATYGLQSGSFDWSLPIPGTALRVSAHAEYGSSKVVEEPFDALDIESWAVTAGFDVAYTAWRTARNDLQLVATAEWRRSQTYLLGSRFSFVAGPEDGEATETVLRVGPQWTYRGANHVIAARSTVSIGLDLLGATQRGGDIPDGQFLSWLIQLQGARRFPWPLPNTQLLARLDAQLTDDPLLGMEQFAVGGRYTVRGYREDLLVRDSAVVGSLELRLPILRRADETPLLELAPFVDAAYVWNVGRFDPPPHWIASVGIGARVALGRRARFEVYWGKQLNRVESSPEWSLQDQGVHAQIAVDLL